MTPSRKNRSRPKRPTSDQIKSIISGLIMAVVIVLPANSQSTHAILSGGGNTATSAEYVCQSTLSQPTIGRVGGDSQADNSADIGFWYVRQRSREIDTSTVSLAMPTMNAETGEFIDVLILQRNNSWPGGEIPKSAVATITFNGSVLQPISPNITCPPSGLCTLDVPLTPSANAGPVGTARFQVKLGDAISSPLHIQRVSWESNKTYRLVTENGAVNVTDVCINGDTVRLIIAGMRTVLRQPTPNPASTSARITFNLVANSRVQLRVVNLEGSTFWSEPEQQLNFGEHERTVDVSLLGAGRYFVVLETDDGTFYQPMLVVR